MALSSDGFASGFTQGFGLVADVQDNFARQKLAEEEVRLRDEDRKERRKDRAADLKYRTDRDAITDQNRLDDIARENTQRDKDNTFRNDKLAYEKSLLNPEENPELAENLRQKKEESKNKQTIFNKQNEELDRQNEERKKEENIVLAGKAANDLLTFEVPLEGLNDTDAGIFNSSVAATDNSVLSIKGALNPFTPEVAQNVAQDIQKFASGQDLSSKENILGGANILVSKNTKGIGETIPASVEGQPHPFPNAPEKFRTGEYEIVSKEAYDVVPNADGSLGITVLVRVKDKKGRITKYLAPVTEGRESNGLGLSIDAEEFTGGFAGMVHYSSEISKNKDALYQGMAEAQYRKNGQYDNAAYKQALREAELSFDKKLEFRAEQKVMQGSNKTFAEIAKDPKLKNEYIRHQLLTNDSIPISYRDETAGEIAETRSLPAITKLEALRKRKAESKGEQYMPLTDTQIIESRTYMGLNKNKDKIIIDDASGFEKWQGKIYGSRIMPTYQSSVAGGYKLPDAD